MAFNKEVVMVSAARTPVGVFNGAFAGTPASKLGQAAIAAALARGKVDAKDVDEVVMGQILTAGTGQNPVRQAALAAGIPDSSTALAINQLCGSGLRSVAMAAQSIALGDAKVVVAGGQESMSQAPHFARLRNGVKMGDATLQDSMLVDGLFCSINGYHMGVTAENIAKRWQLTRDDQDAFACASQNRAEQAQKEGRLDDELVTVEVKTRKQTIEVKADEFPRHGTTVDSLGKLRPAFDKEGSVTAGNASGINDGAAAVVLMSGDDASARGLKPLARVVSWATAGVDPAIMGTGPIPASRKALELAGWKVGDLDLIESNEAFAAQSLAVIKDLDLDPAKTNVNGGAIAIGHPIGASGTRILVTLLYELERRKAKRGLATLCIGGGMGIALCVERAN